MPWWDVFCLVVWVVLWVYISADTARDGIEPQEPTWKAVRSGLVFSTLIAVILLLAGTGAAVIWHQLQAIV